MNLPIKIEDDPALDAKVHKEMRVWEAINEPGAAFRAGVQWMLNRVNAEHGDGDADVYRKVLEKINYLSGPANLAERRSDKAGEGGG